MSDIIDDPYGDDEHPAAYDDTPPPVDPTIDPEWESRAAWHLRRIAHYEDRRNATERAFTREINKLEARLGEALEPLDKKIAWHKTPLVQAHRLIREVDPSRKTIVVPGGKLTSRTPQKPSVSFTDKDAFVRWAQDHFPSLLRVEYKPDVKAIEGALRDLLAPMHEPVPGDPAQLVDKATGEQLPGVHLSIGATSYSVTVDGEDWPE